MEVLMKKQRKLLAVTAGVLLAMGLSVNANADDEGFVASTYYSEDAVTQVFGDGSVLQVFEDGSTLAYDPSSGYATVRAPAAGTQVASKSALDADGFALTQVFDDGSILQM